MTPVDFRNDYLSLWGSGFSISPLFRQSAWFRFHNRDPRIDNLYFVGAGTHPGAGVPGVLSSAKVLQNIINPPVARGRDSRGDSITANAL
jgi:phytoene desaturase